MTRRANGADQNVSSRRSRSHPRADTCCCEHCISRERQIIFVPPTAPLRRCGEEGMTVDMVKILGETASVKGFPA